MSMTPETQQVYDRGYDDGYEAGYLEATRSAVNKISEALIEHAGSEAQKLRAITRTVTELQGERVDD